MIKRFILGVSALLLSSAVMAGSSIPVHFIFDGSSQCSSGPYGTSICGVNDNSYYNTTYSTCTLIPWSCTEPKTLEQINDEIADNLIASLRQYGVHVSKVSHSYVNASKKVAADGQFLSSYTLPLTIAVSDFASAYHSQIYGFEGSHAYRNGGELIVYVLGDDVRVDNGACEGRSGTFVAVTSSCTNVAALANLLKSTSFYADLIPGSLEQVSMGDGNEIWGINSSGHIYRYNPGYNWQRIEGILSHISVGQDGDVWGVNSSGAIYRWHGGSGTGNHWTRIPGVLRKVEVGGNGEVWGITASGSIYRWYGGNNVGNYWTLISGVLSDIAVGPNGEVWGVNSSGAIYRRIGGAGGYWTRVQGSLSQIDIGPDGVVLGANSGNHVYRWLGGNSWQHVDSGLRQVSVGLDQSYWGINANSQIFRRGW